MRNHQGTLRPRELLPALAMALLGALPMTAWALVPGPEEAVAVLLAPGDRAEDAALRIADAPGWRLLRAGPDVPLPILIAMPEPGADPAVLRRALRGLLLISARAGGCAPATEGL